MPEQSSIVETLKNLVVNFSGDSGVVVVQRVYIEWTKELAAGAVLSRLIWEVGRSEADRFDATQAYWEAALYLKDDARRRIVKKLTAMNIGLSARKLNAGGIRYRFEWSVFLRAFLEHIAPDSGLFSGIDSGDSRESIPGILGNVLIYRESLKDIPAGSGEKPRNRSESLNVVAEWCFGVKPDDPLSDDLYERITKKIFKTMNQTFTGQGRVTAEEWLFAARSWRADNPTLHMPQDGLKIANAFAPYIRKKRAMAARPATDPLPPSEPELPTIEVNADGTPRTD